MSRIGKKPIPLGNGEVHRAGQHGAGRRPQGQVDSLVPAGITLEEKDGNLFAVRKEESQARCTA